jgi:hypothetical protein
VVGLGLEVRVRVRVRVRKCGTSAFPPVIQTMKEVVGKELQLART